MIPDYISIKLLKNQKELKVLACEAARMVQLLTKWEIKEKRQIGVK